VRALHGGILSCAAALLAACAAAPEGAPARIVIDPGVHYQRITGWEASAQPGEIAAPPSVYRDRLAELAVNDLGINRLRVKVRSGAENSRDYWAEMRAGRLRENWRCVRYATVNDNADPGVIDRGGFHWGDLDAQIEDVVLPMKRRLEARGEHLFVNLLYVAFYNQCPNVPYIHTNPEEYAEFILAASLHLRQKYAIVPDAWEVVLEPDNTPFWRGRQLGEAIAATGRRLKAAGFAPRFIAPSTTSMANTVPYFDQLVRVPGALQWMSEISYHRYHGTGAANLRAIAERAERYHIDSAMLEHIGSGYDDLQRDLEIGRVSAWQEFALAFPTGDNGAQYYLVGKDGSVEPARRTRFLRQYFHYVRAGAVRIGATSDNPDLDPLAFVNADGRYVVVVKADAPGSVSIAGLPAGKYVVSYTTDDQAGRETAVTLVSGGQLSARIPARGVMTIAGTSRATASR